MSGLRFLEPAWLGLLLVVLALGVAHGRMANRRRRTAIRYTNAELVRLVLPNRPGWRRHVTAGLFLAGMAGGVVAMARPAVPFQVEREQATVMLAMDVSPSMMATDVAPSRFVAAVDSARQFLATLPSGFGVGLTSFAGTAQVLVPPTTDRDLVARTLERLQFRSETAIGDALLASVDAAAAAGDPETTLVILLSDGASTTGTAVDEGVDGAIERGVPVSTIAFGTDDGTITLGDTTVEVPPDAGTLADIADRTGGAFVRATTGDELALAYQELGGELRSRTVPRELYPVAFVAAVALLVGSASCSLLWFGRLV